MMVDIDFFKKLNDNYGHAFGDLCLVRAAQLIRKVVTMRVHLPPVMVVKSSLSSCLKQLKNALLRLAKYLDQHLKKRRDSR